MAGRSDDDFLAKGGLALVQALRTVGRDPDQTEAALAEAEQQFTAVLERNQRTPEPAAKATKKGQNQ